MSAPQENTMADVYVVTVAIVFSFFGMLNASGHHGIV
jgi:hypothetical protein